jgi:thioredoxin 1
MVFTITLAVPVVTIAQQNAPQLQIYQPTNVTPGMLAHAIKTAREQNKFLMVEFGANWCEDCVALARNLEQGETRDYFQKHFVVLKVDVGQFNRNLDVARSLGVDLDKGIPTAAFFAPDGNKVGATNKGELEPSRKYGSKQIYAFLREIAERRVITIPGLK